MDHFWHIQWEQPDMLWGLTSLPLLGYLLWYDWRLQRRLVRCWSQVPGVLHRSALPSGWQAAGYGGVLLLGFALSIAGFASPTLPAIVWEPAWERVAIGLLLDVSPSMRAPAEAHDPTGASRLDVLKQAVQELLLHLPGGVRVGVIAFAGVAVPVVAEPSADHQAILAKIRRLDPTFIASPGTNLSAAIQQGFALFTTTTPETQPDVVALLLMGDGDTTRSRSLQTVLRQAKLPIFTLATGTLQPVSIPDAHAVTGLLTDTHGRPVTTAVDETVLRLIAEQTGGRYHPFTERTVLAHTLRQLVMQQGQRVTQPVPRPRTARWHCFLVALGCLVVYQCHARPQQRRQRQSAKQTTLV